MRRCALVPLTPPPCPLSCLHLSQKSGALSLLVLYTCSKRHICAYVCMYVCMYVSALSMCTLTRNAVLRIQREHADIPTLNVSKRVQVKTP